MVEWDLRSSPRTSARLQRRRNIEPSSRSRKRCLGQSDGVGAAVSYPAVAVSQLPARPPARRPGGMEDDLDGLGVDATSVRTGQRGLGTIDLAGLLARPD